MSQSDVEPFGTIDVASTYWTCASLLSWTSGWYSCCARAVPMALMPPKNGSRVSLLDPPVSPTLRSPPVFAAAVELAVGEVVGAVPVPPLELELHASSRP